MPERNPEAFSNPLPPESGSHHHHRHEEEDAQPLTNDDFRKLMMTPRVPSQSSSASHSFATPASTSKPRDKPRSADGEEGVEDGDDPGARRRKKKIYYAKLKKLEEEREKELAEKYRDRAAERRDGHHNDDGEMINTTADYRNVAPDAKIDNTMAERRKQVIQESKYLGGDMEHTHLVKGLDYALLEKVRAEITNKETADEQLERLAKESKEEKKVEEEEVQQMTFRTRMGKNIFKQLFQTKVPERNELFLPGRMAYVVDLEDEFGDSDVPCTSIRSKADCPSLESTTTLTTNDIVISKLTQILSYLRQGKRDNKKLKKKEKGKHRDEYKGADENIYGDQEIGDYVPSYNKSKNNKDRSKSNRGREDDYDRKSSRSDRDRRDKYDRDRRDRKDRDYERPREKKKSYFEKPAEEEEERLPNAKELVSSINEKFNKGWAPADLEREGGLQPGEKPKPSKEEERLKKLKKLEQDSYAECYPGMMESADALDDSDDEVDYSKMDTGNKKGPIGRWDFDTQEEYSDYMSNKEALPKAAFQYGVKMSDGRKTRRAGPKDEKAQLDREWQKIQNIISKRKPTGGGGGPKEKSARY